MVQAHPQVSVCGRISFLLATRFCFCFSLFVVQSETRLEVASDGIYIFITNKFDAVTNAPMQIYLKKKTSRREKKHALYPQKRTDQQSRGWQPDWSYPNPFSDVLELSVYMYVCVCVFTNYLRLINHAACQNKCINLPTVYRNGQELLN